MNIGWGQQLPTWNAPSGLTSSFVLDALLKHQMFPNSKDLGDELPPFFSSESFSRDIAEALSNLGAPTVSSHVKLRSRRYDGLIRRLGVPHPVPYSRLVLHLEEHWGKILLKLGSPQSRVQPTATGRGPRIIQMNYEDTRARATTEIHRAQGMEYRVEADISSFFPSIYSHSIDWALRGKDLAKAGRKSQSWQPKLDELVRNCHNKETAGLMIGPAVSNVLSELVLQRVDEGLSSEGFDFVRYVDDFSAYFPDRLQAERFISRLDWHLDVFRLTLNTRKTRIVSLRTGFGDEWVSRLRGLQPAEPTPIKCLDYLRMAELLAQGEPRHSVMVFAVKSLLGLLATPQIGASRNTSEVDHATRVLAANEILRLCLFHPHLLKYFTRLLADVVGEMNGDEKDHAAERLWEVVVSAAARFETDTVLWGIYAVRKVLKRRLKVRQIEPLLEMEDDMVSLVLAMTVAAAKPRVVRWVKSIDLNDDVECQGHWLVRYEAFRQGWISDRDLAPQEKGWFRTAKQEGLRFTGP